MAVPEVGARLRAALHAALRQAGAPDDAARALARSATFEDHDGELVLCLNGHHAPPDDDGGHLGAVDHLAENAAADNAEAFDRQQRGEPGCAPWWALPHRRPRVRSAHTARRPGTRPSPGEGQR